jgi:hypothetical protein
MRQRQPDRGCSPLPDAPHGVRDCGQTASDPRDCRAVRRAATRYHGYMYSSASWLPRATPPTRTGILGQVYGAWRPTYVPIPRTLLWGGVGRDLGVFVRERRDALEHLIAMNTPRPADGVIRSWVDGKLAYEKKNMVLRIPRPRQSPCPDRVAQHLQGRRPRQLRRQRRLARPDGAGDRLVLGPIRSGAAQPTPRMP